MSRLLDVVGVVVVVRDWMTFLILQSWGRFKCSMSSMWKSQKLVAGID
jgi:hypothetical protein